MLYKNSLDHLSCFRTQLDLNEWILGDNNFKLQTQSWSFEWESCHSNVSIKNLVYLSFLIMHSSYLFCGFLQGLEKRVVWNEVGDALPGAQLWVGHRRWPNQGANQLLKQYCNSNWSQWWKKSSSLQFIAKLCTPVWFPVRVS